MIPAPAADEPTRRERHGHLHDNGSRLIQASGKQEDADGAEDNADEKNYDGVSAPALPAWNTQ
jgi:hypothetical protein